MTESYSWQRGNARGQLQTIRERYKEEEEEEARRLRVIKEREKLDRYQLSYPLLQLGQNNFLTSHFLLANLSKAFSLRQGPLRRRLHNLQNHPRPPTLQFSIQRERLHPGGLPRLLH